MRIINAAHTHTTQAHTAHPAQSVRSLSPPPPPPELDNSDPDSTFQAEPGELEIFCTDFDMLPPPTPPQDEESSSQLEEDMRTPSTIFRRNNGGDRESPWGPPTKSMTKKKGWVEPPRPIAHKPVKQEAKRLTDNNELFNVFDRLHKGGGILKPAINPEDVDVLQKDKLETNVQKIDDEIGGNIHVRISYSTPTTLHVTIREADDILIKSKFTKTCSPYAMVTLLGDYEVCRTRVAPRTQCPVWNETFDFALPQQFLQSTDVLVVVYSKTAERREGFLGETHISLAKFKHFNVVDDWYTLEDLRGEAAKFDGYKELQKVLRSLKSKAPLTLHDTLAQDELRKNENYSSYM